MLSPIRSALLLFFLGGVLLSSCDNGLTPPEEEARGQIRGRILYEGAWPSADSLRELRFVGMRFVPQDTSDFLQLNRMVISDTLARFVSEDSFFISNVGAGVYVYSGVAENFGSGILDWRPIGLFSENEGTFVVRGSETTDISVYVDLSNRPPFPPEIED